MDNFTEFINFGQLSEVENYDFIVSIRDREHTDCERWYIATFSREKAKELSDWLLKRLEETAK